MKKISTTLFLAAALTTGAFAQSSGETGGPSKPQLPAFNKSKLTAKYHNQERATSYWLNYAFAADSLYGNLATINANYLFPDSTVLGEFGVGTFDYVWVHSIAQTMDPTAYYHNFYSGCTITDNDAFSVDSMGIVYVYERNIQNNNIVDTLVVKLLHNGTTANFLSSGFIGTTAANYGTDTVGFKHPKYDYISNMATGTTNTTVVKIPLTIADTSVTFFGYKAFGVNNFVVPAGKVVAATIMFKPGYTYAFDDTLETELNSFLFASYEEQGAGTFPIYNDCNYQASNCDFNVSGIVRTNERYNEAGNSWNGNYIPTWAFTAPYSLEHHIWDWKVTTPPTSIKEINELGIGLGQNVPNPADNSTKIIYSLKKGGNVTFDVTDLTGKVVYSTREGNKQAGDHSIVMDVNSLNAGIYFYSISVDGARVTKKMTVTK